MSGSLWLLGIARNAVVVLLASVLVLMLERHELQPFSTTGDTTVGVAYTRIPIGTTRHQQLVGLTVFFCWD